MLSTKVSAELSSSASHVPESRWWTPFWDLGERRREPEWLDQPGIASLRRTQALRGLKRVNAISRSHAVLWPVLERLSRDRKPNPVRVLDIACGGGDVALSLAHQARRHQLNIAVDGCDINRETIQFARHQAMVQDLSVQFFNLDVLQDPLPDNYDLLTCTLFLHHLSNLDAVELLGRMRKAAQHQILVDDLIRSHVGWCLAWLGSHLLSTSDVVHHDGPISAAAAFTMKEVRELAEHAGLENATVTRHWPERFLLSWSRS